MSRTGRPPQTHCKRGHALEDAYIIRRKDGSTYRRCRQCSIATAKAYSREHYVPHPRPEPQIASDRLVLAYTAGLFDGEGSVMVRLLRKKGQEVARFHNLSVSVTSTDRDVIDWLQANFGGQIGAHHGRGLQRDAWKWQLLARHAEAFLRAIHPWLIIKREHAKIALALRETMGLPGGAPSITPELFAKREGLRLRLKELNRRGRDRPIEGA